MLPVHLQELLTASIDGELTNAERRLVDKLLRESAEARTFHARISNCAHRLRQSAGGAAGRRLCCQRFERDRPAMHHADSLADAAP